MTTTEQMNIATAIGLINGSIRGIKDFGRDIDLDGLIKNLEEIKSLLPKDKNQELSEKE